MFFIFDAQINFYLMISCLVVNLLLNLEEMAIYSKYGYRVQSKINIINILIFYVYFYFRIFVFHDQTGSPLTNFGGESNLQKVSLRDQVLF